MIGQYSISLTILMSFVSLIKTDCPSLPSYCELAKVAWQDDLYNIYLTFDGKCDYSGTAKEAVKLLAMKRLVLFDS